ncbi:hypothetical protein M3A49_21725 [Paraburkholderia sp. CNPSo 3076]|uniref:hypothetical protein n=1 Tax=Paraburkholderia sp. CNPSo 3076 TaxID=2940936 RepID=UPI002253D240|nr:hypothetical protein [Paraburkholderia sp. CNPSo 3076]MCX5542097.1 hypothetical protein [Paraburkholderia sp. CNPSo 3076]
MARLVVALLLIVSSSAWSDTPPPKAAPGNTDIFVPVIIGATYIVTVFCLFRLWRLLNQDSAWSWAKALSDEAIVSKPPPEPTTTVLKNPDGTTASETTSFEPSDYSELTGSTSRVIAIFGMVVILFMFLGFGSVAMWRYAYFGDAQNAMDMMKILFAGVALFVPYGFNQVQKAISAFGSQK